MDSELEDGESCELRVRKGSWGELLFWGRDGQGGKQQEGSQTKLALGKEALIYGQHQLHQHQLHNP